MASDEVTITALTGIFSLLGTIYTGVMAYFMLKLRGTLDDVHTLVNSNMGAQLELNLTISKRIAAITKNKADAEAVVVSQRLLDEHRANQSIVDNK